MSTLREAAQQALEALEALDAPPSGVVDHYELDRRKQALRAALAQQQEQKQEPVAWIQPDHLQKARQAPFLCRVEPTKRMSDFVPIFTHPPRREWQGLTEEEIGDVFQAARNAKLGSANDNSRHRLSVVEIARAIEQALKERNT
jgi:hypothetical protein